LQEVLTLGPPTVLVWLPGLIALSSWRTYADLRWIALSFMTLIVVTVVLHGKPYYPAAAYPLLMVAGAVALERWLGLQPSTGERIKLGVLPQYFADMFGWRELAHAVGKATQALPSSDREKAVFFGRNYGEAAAVEYFGVPFAAPPAISAHQNYFLWGPGDSSGEVILLLAEPSDRRLQAFRACERVGWLDNPLGQPEESNQILWLCRNSTEPLSRLWPRWRHFG
jgi:hypothetical protein